MANKTNCQSILNTAEVFCRKRRPKSPSWVEEKIIHFLSQIVYCDCIGLCSLSYCHYRRQWLWYGYSLM